MCHAKNVREVTAAAGKSAQPDSFFLDAVNSGDDAWYVNIGMCGTALTFKIDTGADITVMSQDTYNRLSIRPKLTKLSTNLMSPGGKLECNGCFTAATTYKNRCYDIDVYVAASPYANNLLGRNEATMMGLVKRLEEVIWGYEDVFGDIGLMDAEPVKIKLRRDAIPYSVVTPRRIPFPQLPKVEAEIKCMLQMGVIEEVTEPMEWCAPMVPVPKKNGTVRICVDLKWLNEAVEREKFVLPTLEDIAPELVASTVYSTLDASSGFWQLPLDPESSKLTTFLSPFGRFCFRRLPFGITSAPEIYQRRMERLLEGLTGVKTVMDDILVYGNKGNHEARRIRSSGLKLNKDKCHLQRSKVEYFGHELSKDGVHAQSSKVEAIKDLPTP